MNNIDIVKTFFKETNEPELLCSDSLSRETSLPNNYLSNKADDKWKSIPNEMKKLNQWVTWKKVLRGDKETKVPYQPNGQKANVTDRDTWSSFENVKHLCNVGFVFNENDPYVFIDIDGDKASGIVSPSASFWISKLNSYTEYSPSKIGFHIIIKGQKKIKDCRRGDFEIYDRNRFATFTGDIYQGLNNIENRQGELDRLQRLIWPEKFIKEKEHPKTLNDINSISIQDIVKFCEKDDKLRKLWSGDISGYQTASEADLALCEKLAFYTGGCFDLIEHLFGQSELARDKWFDRSDYRIRTIGIALEGINEFYQQSTINNSNYTEHDKKVRNDSSDDQKYPYPKPIPLTEIIHKEFPPRRDVIKDLIPSGLSLVMASEKIGKSSMLRQVGFSVATGMYCFGGNFSPSLSGNVLYLSFEDSDQSIQESMSMFCQSSAPPNYQFQYKWPRIGNGCMRALEAYVNDFPNTKLIIIDTMAYIRRIDKGNISYGRYVEDVEDFNKLKTFSNKHNLSIMVSTHTGKAKHDDWTRNVHGGVGQTATADTIIYLERERGKSKGFFHITGKRIRDKCFIAKFEYRAWSLQEYGQYFNLTPSVQEFWDVFVDNGNRQMTPKEFADILYPDLDDEERSKRYDSVRQQLYRMGKNKKIKKVERSYYKMFRNDFEEYKKVKEFESEE